MGIHSLNSKINRVYAFISICKMRSLASLHVCVCPWPFYLFWLKLAPRPGIPLQAHDEENGPDIIENHVFYMCVTLKTIQEVSYTYKEPDRRTTMLGEIRQMMEDMSPEDDRDFSWYRVKHFYSGVASRFQL